MNILALLSSIKQHFTGLILKSVTDDLQTAVSLNRADRLRQMEEQATHDRDAGNIATAMLLESTAERLGGGGQLQEGMTFLSELIEQTDSPLELTHATHDAPPPRERSTRRRGRPPKRREESATPSDD